MNYAQTYMTGWVGERILADLRTTLFGHLQRLSLGFYERNRAGVIISRLTNDVEAIDQLVTDGVTRLVQSTLTLIGTAVMLFVLDWRLALATCAVLPLMSVATALFRTRSARAYAPCASGSGSSRRRSPRTSPACGSSRPSRASTPRTPTSARSAERYRESNMQTVVLNGLYFPAVDFLSSIALAIVLGYGGYLYFGGSITIGTLFAFMLYVQNFFDPVQQLSQLYNTFLSATAALDKIMGVLDEKPEVADAAGARRAARDRRAASASRTCASGTAAATRCCTGSTSTSRPERPSRSSVTPVRASRRSPSCSPVSTIRPRAG